METKATNLDYYLTQEKEALNQILNQLNQLCEQNKQLQNLIEIQKEVKELEKEHIRSLPWFKRLINTVSNIKYVFVKSEEQLTTEAVKRNKNLLQKIDNTVLSIADKSGPLKQILQKEIRKDFDYLAKKDLNDNQRTRLAKLFNGEYAGNSGKFAQLAMIKPLNLSKAEELENQYNYLNTIKQNVQNLLTENSNIRELKEIQQQITEIREEIPLTFFEKLNNKWQKIKNIFVDNSEQILAKNKESNIKTIGKIDEHLEKAKLKFNGLTNNTEKNINKIISRLPKNMGYQAHNMLADFKSADLFAPINQDEQTNITPNEKTKFATIRRVHKTSYKTATVNETGSNSFTSPDESMNSSLLDEKKMQMKLFGADLPNSSTLNENTPTPTFSTFVNPKPRTLEQAKITLNEEDYRVLKQIKHSVSDSSNVGKLNDVASVFAAKAAMNYSSDSDSSDSGFSSNTNTSSKKFLKTRNERNASRLSSFKQ